jgi:hypothetical protein
MNYKKFAWWWYDKIQQTRLSIHLWKANLTLEFFQPPIQGMMAREFNVQPFNLLQNLAIMQHWLIRNRVLPRRNNLQRS